jgi:hypothetical protein
LFLKKTYIHLRDDRCAKQLADGERVPAATVLLLEDRLEIV